MDTKRPARPWSVLVGALVLVALIAVWAAQGTLAGSGVPIGRAATIAVGMTLQAIPFLLLGVFRRRTHRGLRLPRPDRARFSDEPGCVRVDRSRRCFPSSRV